MVSEIRVTYIDPRDLLPSKRNVRSDPGDLAGLAETIREHGILQPLGVTRENGDFRVVYGNRRRDAAIVVGLERVPCLVLDALDDEEIVVQQVLENLQRLDLSDMDKSDAFGQLVEIATKDGVSTTDALAELARTLGLSARQIQRYLRLRQLDPRVQTLLQEGDLGVTHGQHLVDIKPAERQLDVARLAVEETLSAAELSRLCQTLIHNGNIAPETALDMLRRGDRVPQVEEQVRQAMPRMSAGGQPRQEQDAPWNDEDDAPEEQPAYGERYSEGPRPDQVPADPATRDVGLSSPATRDGNRVRKIHSMDSFMDELERMTRCVQDGDLQTFITESDASLMKLRLAARQLGFLANAVQALAQASGANE